MKRWLTLLSLPFAACAAIDPRTLEEAGKPIICGDKAQCDLYWQRAQGWINKYSHYRIQIVTDTILSTYGPARELYEPCCGYNLTRIPNADGTEVIDVDLICGAFSCTDTESMAALKRHIKGQ